MLSQAGSVSKKGSFILSRAVQRGAKFDDC